MAKFFSFMSKSDQESAKLDTLKEHCPCTPTESFSGATPLSFDVASSRFTKISTGWFVRTREKEDLGPFPTEQEAFDALFDYLNLTTPNDKREYSPQIVYGMLIHDPETCLKDLCALCIEAEASQEEAWRNCNNN